MVSSLMSFAAIIFDVDGVLLDSLGSHLAICRDKSAKYGLGLTIPDTEQFKAMVRSGVTISPMEKCFLAVGFPPAEAKRATADYDRHFMRDYAPKPFPDVRASLHALRRAGYRLGIVTSNVRANIEKALGSDMECFEPVLCLTHDSDAMQNKSKADALRLIAERMPAAPHECVYIGDQPADFKAAQSAGFQFIGVTYGWGISASDTDFPTFNSLSALQRSMSDGD